MKNEILSIKMPKALKERLKRAADREGRTLSSFMRHHLQLKLEEAQGNNRAKKEVTSL